MVQTIRFAKELRPFAKWGFYGFPYCDKDAGQNGICKQDYRRYNSRLVFSKTNIRSVELWSDRSAFLNWEKQYYFDYICTASMDRLVGFQVVVLFTTLDTLSAIYYSITAY